jgi:Ca2+-binding EF-hand superfamily protein
VQVSLDELASVMLSKKKMNSKEQKLSELGAELFSMFDKDGEGSISLQEMVDTFTQTGKNWDMEDVKTFFELIDLDKSGEVDYEEFMSFIHDVETMSK